MLPTKHDSVRTGRKKLAVCLMALLSFTQMSFAAMKTDVAVQVKPDTLQEADAQLLEASGIHAVRFGVYYSPDMDTLGQKAQEWPRYDRLFGLLKKHHMRVLFTAYVPPALISEQLKQQKAPMTNGVYDAGVVRERLHKDLDVLVRNVFARYGDQLLGVEVWNEPDNPRFWTRLPELGKFASAMGGICETAKPWPKLPVYGFGFIFLPGGQNTTTPLYDELKQQDATACFSVSGHFYRDHAELVAKEIEEARKYSGGATVIVSEEGASALPGKRTEESQADLATRMLLSSMMAGVPLASIYEFKDTADATPEREKHFGLLHSDGTKKSLYDEIKNLLDLYNAATDVSIACSNATCRFDMNVKGQKYAIVWREDEKTVLLSEYVKADEIDTKLLRATEDFYTSSPEIITITQSPLLVKFK